MDSRTAYKFDENLRDIPIDPAGLREYTQELIQSLASTREPKRRVGLLGELGVHLRSLGDLNEAEKCLTEALEMIRSHQLGLRLEVQQKLRLAHVHQWKKEFLKSDALFFEAMGLCRDHSDAGMYLDFALQHAGKNQFDQKNWQAALKCFEEALDLRQKRRAPQDQIESTKLAIARTKERIKKV